MKSIGNDVNRQLYKFEWTDNFLKLIRTVELTRPSVAKFLTSESGISAINFMPVTPEEKSTRDKDREIRWRTQNTLTYKDEKNAQKTLRMPPMMYAFCLQLYTTYAVLLVMFFTPTNRHLKCLNAVTGQLREM